MSFSERICPVVVFFQTMVLTQCTGVITKTASGPLSELRVAAERGDAAAQFKLGSSYYNGVKVPNKATRELRTISR